MKLRIYKQSLRFRLTPDDMIALKKEKNLHEKLSIAPQSDWSYKLSLAQDPLAHIQPNTSGLEISIPEEAFLQWMDSTENEWSYLQESPALKISIEKDLKPHRH